MQSANLSNAVFKKIILKIGNKSVVLQDRRSDEKLEKIRNEFKDHNYFCIEDYMVFLNSLENNENSLGNSENDSQTLKNKEQRSCSEILREHEKDIRLKDVVKNGGTLEVIDPRKFTCSKFIDHFKLNRGLEIGRHDYLDFVQKEKEHAIEYQCKFGPNCKGVNTYTRDGITRDQIQSVYNTSENNNASLNAGVNFKNQYVSAKAEGSYSSTDQRQTNSEVSSSSEIFFYIRAEVTIHEANVSNDLLKIVKEIVKFDEMMDELKERIEKKSLKVLRTILKKYGKFDSECSKDYNAVSELIDKYTNKEFLSDEEKDSLSAEFDEIEDIKARFEKIYERFGKFYGKKFYLGGKLTKRSVNNLLKDNIHNSHNLSGGLDIKAINNGVGVKAQHSHSTDKNNLYVTKQEEFDAIGGDSVNVKDDNKASWIDSLKRENWKKWKVIFYEAEPIFNLLYKNDINLNYKVIRKILGKRILASDIETNVQLNTLHLLNFKNKKFNNLEKYQIFASVIDQERKNNIFSVRVVRNKKKETCLLVHQINGEKNTFKVNVGWIIIGYPQDFHNFKGPEFKYSMRKPIENINSPVPIDSYDNSYSLLVTCEQHLLSDNEDKNLENAISFYLPISDNPPKAHTIAFDPKSREVIEQIEGSGSKLFIHYSVIADGSVNRMWTRQPFKLLNWINSILFNRCKHYALFEEKQQDNDQKFICIYNEKGFVNYSSAYNRPTGICI
ncbi:25560_t:CDS:2 [Dentiscutata erythropus]|uniref:25560_t:CDS:1 n=1 Tax=Dentiscutata erythropus TaxID=1348616 RepID=A0A9N8WID8_9GLOM|nr:25560_t:CDS:2 [Dentiscutata erythropus]